MTKRSGSSHWRKKESLDPDFQKAKRLGFRSRASLKLQEIHRRDPLFRKNQWVLDLGAAPGGWSQVALGITGPNRVVGIDLLPIAPLSGATFLQGDVCAPEMASKLSSLLPKKGVSLVISDMAPNISGIKHKDQASSLALAELAFAQSHVYLQKGGHFLVKLFQGPDVQLFCDTVKPHFEKVRWLKPKASRADSTEVYLLAKGMIEKSN